MIVVANAGPLISLAQIGQLDLLPALYGNIYIPPAVKTEVVAHGGERPGAAAIGLAGWITVLAVRDQTAVELLQERLDVGESAAIVLAIEQHADLLLIDEARGRRVAHCHGTPPGLLSLHPYTPPLRPASPARPARTSRGALTTRAVWFVRAWDDAEPAVVGWGEAGPVPGLSRDDRPDFAAACAAHVAAIDAGAHPLLLDLDDLPAFAFGLETALFDLYSGGRQQLWPTPFSRGEVGLPTHGLIWMDDPAGMLAQIEAKIAAGFGVIKLKVGALPFAAEVALLAEVRRRHPEIELRLDANGAFAAEEALGKLEQLAPLGIAFLEQPIQPGQWDTLAEICRRSPIPIALDEELIACSDPAARRRLLDTVRPTAPDPQADAAGRAGCVRSVGSGRHRARHPVVGEFAAGVQHRSQCHLPVDGQAGRRPRAWPGHGAAVYQQRTGALAARRIAVGDRSRRHVGIWGLGVVGFWSGGCGRNSYGGGNIMK
jgi:predicted nucleic acid-binding protein/O-succinylbenzoate synthase